MRSASVHAADVPAAAALATPFLTAPGGGSPTPAGEFPLELQVAPGSNGKGILSVPAQNHPPSKTETAPPASTPLLDAAIQRVADITRQQRDEIASTPSPEPVEEAKRPKAAAPARAQSALVLKTITPDRRPRDPDAPPLPQRISRTPEDTHPRGESAPQAAKAPEPRVVAGPPKPIELKTPESKGPEPKTPEPKTPNSTPAARKAADPISGEHVTELRIGDLRFCRKVLGFGSFEGLETSRVKAEQHLLLYCELTGIQYETLGDDFVSRISSRVEVKPAAGGAVVWSHELGDAQDVCRRRRRDYYVNYRIELPSSLTPGSYRLRLLQTDLVAGSTTSGEIPFEITP